MTLTTYHHCGQTLTIDHVLVEYAVWQENAILNLNYLPQMDNTIGFIKVLVDYKLLWENPGCLRWSICPEGHIVVNTNAIQFQFNSRAVWFRALFNVLIIVVIIALELVNVMNKKLQKQITFSMGHIVPSHCRRYYPDTLSYSQLIWRLYTLRWNLRLSDLHMGCSDFG